MPNYEEQINDLQRQIDQLKSSTTLPLDIAEAFKIRLVDVLPGIATQTTKSATAENKTVDEAGVASYQVMNKPDGFLKVTITGIIYYIPYFL